MADREQRIAALNETLQRSALEATEAVERGFSYHIVDDLDDNIHSDNKVDSDTRQQDIPFESLANGSSGAAEHREESPVATPQRAEPAIPVLTTEKYTIPSSQKSSRTVTLERLQDLLTAKSSEYIHTLVRLMIWSEECEAVSPDKLAQSVQADLCAAVVTRLSNAKKQYFSRGRNLPETPPPSCLFLCRYTSSLSTRGRPGPHTIPQGNYLADITRQESFFLRIHHGANNFRDAFYSYMARHANNQQSNHMLSFRLRIAEEYRQIYAYILQNHYPDVRELTKQISSDCTTCDAIRSVVDRKAIKYMQQLPDDPFALSITQADCLSSSNSLLLLSGLTPLTSIFNIYGPLNDDVFSDILLSLQERAHEFKGQVTILFITLSNLLCSQVLSFFHALAGESFLIGLLHLHIDHCNVTTDVLSTICAQAPRLLSLSLPYNCIGPSLDKVEFPSALMDLNLSYNCIESTGDAFLSLPALQILKLGANSLSRIPRLSSCYLLSNLSLEDNKIEHAQLMGLRYNINLRDIQLSGNSASFFFEVPREQVLCFPSLELLSFDDSTTRLVLFSPKSVYFPRLKKFECTLQDTVDLVPRLLALQASLPVIENFAIRNAVSPVTDAECTSLALAFPNLQLFNGHQIPKSLRQSRGRMFSASTASLLGVTSRPVTEETHSHNDLHLSATDSVSAMQNAGTSVAPHSFTSLCFSDLSAQLYCTRAPRVQHTFLTSCGDFDQQEYFLACRCKHHGASQQLARSQLMLLTSSSSREDSTLRGRQRRSVSTIGSPLLRALDSSMHTNIHQFISIRSLPGKFTHSYTVHDYTFLTLLDDLLSALLNLGLERPFTLHAALRDQVFNICGSQSPSKTHVGRTSHVASLKGLVSLLTRLVCLSIRYSLTRPDFFRANVSTVDPKLYARILQEKLLPDTLDSVIPRLNLSGAEVPSPFQKLLAHQMRSTIMSITETLRPGLNSKRYSCFCETSVTSGYPRTSFITPRVIPNYALRHRYLDEQISNAQTSISYIVRRIRDRRKLYGAFLDVMQSYKICQTCLATRVMHRLLATRLQAYKRTRANQAAIQLIHPILQTRLQQRLFLTKRAGLCKIQRQERLALQREQAQRLATFIGPAVACILATFQKSELIVFVTSIRILQTCIRHVLFRRRLQDKLAMARCTLKRKKFDLISRLHSDLDRVIGPPGADVVDFARTLVSSNDNESHNLAWVDDDFLIEASGDAPNLTAILAEAESAAASLANTGSYVSSKHSDRFIFHKAEEPTRSIGSLHASDVQDHSVRHFDDTPSLHDGFSHCDYIQLEAGQNALATQRHAVSTTSVSGIGKPPPILRSPNLSKSSTTTLPVKTQFSSMVVRDGMIIAQGPVRRKRAEQNKPAEIKSATSTHSSRSRSKHSEGQHHKQMFSQPVLSPRQALNPDLGKSVARRKGWTIESDEAALAYLLMQKRQKRLENAGKTITASQRYERLLKSNRDASFLDGSPPN